MRVHLSKAIKQPYGLMVEKLPMKIVPVGEIAMFDG
jgi:hypothetical protein